MGGGWVVVRRRPPQPRIPPHTQQLGRRTVAVDVILPAIVILQVLRTPVRVGLRVDVLVIQPAGLPCAGGLAGRA